jgi:hypothetical protein
LKVKNPSHSSFVKSLGIKGGEAQVLMLHEKSFAISSDDAKFLENLKEFISDEEFYLAIDKVEK